MEPSVEIQYRALLDTNNINLPTRNYSLPNSGNTQTSHGYLNQEGIDAYLPPSSSESFEKLWDYIMGNATLPSWESLGPTSNSKGANSYSMGLSVINVIYSYLFVILTKCLISNFFQFFFSLLVRAWNRSTWS